MFTTLTIVLVLISLIFAGLRYSIKDALPLSVYWLVLTVLSVVTFTVFANGDTVASMAFASLTLYVLIVQFYYYDKLDKQEEHEKLHQAGKCCRGTVVVGPVRPAKGG